MASRVIGAFLMSTHVSRRQAMAGSLLTSLLSVASKAPFDEGYVAVTREGDKYSLYYRLYAKEETTIPLVVLHGGP